MDIAARPAETTAVAGTTPTIRDRGAVTGRTVRAPGDDSIMYDSLSDDSLGSRGRKIAGLETWSILEGFVILGRRMAGPTSEIVSYCIYPHDDQ